jgi:Zn-dependent oligopeptidase
VPTLEAIRAARSELAALAGAESFVAMNASDRMLGSGEAAVDFLRGLARALLPRAALEARALARIKAQCLARGEGSEGEGCEGEG